jgi:hypothetical protein
MIFDHHGSPILLLLLLFLPRRYSPGWALASLFETISFGMSVGLTSHTLDDSVVFSRRLYGYFGTVEEILIEDFFVVLHSLIIICGEQ